MSPPDPTESEPAGPSPAEPPLTDSARAVFGAARGLAGAFGGNLKALRRLLVADIALARTALIHALVMLFAVAILLGTAWVLLTGLAVYGLHAAGAGWAVAIAVPMLVSVVLGGFAMWHATRVLHDADMDASRREFGQWFGRFEDLADAARAGDSGEPAAAERPKPGGTP